MRAVAAISAPATLARARPFRQSLVDEDIRKVDAWTARYSLVTVAYAAEPFDPFFNANRPEDLAEAERILAGL